MIDIEEARQRNKDKGHIYLIDLLDNERIKRLNNKYEKVKNFNYIETSKPIKINYKQFPSLSQKDVNNKLNEYNMNIFGFGERYLNLKPIENDVYINEIYFLKYLDNKLIDTYISPYWEFNFCIFDKECVIKKLIKKSYLNIDFSIGRFLTNKKITELKEILKNNNIYFKSNLKKQELINLIIENKIDIEITPTYYMTNKGHILIENCNVYFENRRIGYPIEENDLQANNDFYYWLPIYVKKYESKFLWGLLRNLYHNFSNLYDENSKQFLFNCFILDLSGLANNGYDKPENILIVNMYKNAFTKDIDNLIDKSIYNELPFNYLSKDEIKEIIYKINNQ